MTATVETVAEQLDLAPVVAPERIIPAVARQVTISDADVATATAKVASATLVGENDQLLEGPEEDQENFWQTSEGKFHFVIAELPAHLQLLHTLLNNMPRSSVPELYHALQCIHILVLHGDAFTKASKDDRGFFIWCQENLLIKNLWEFCNAAQSHIGEVVVPLLLHCITLPSGSDTFWRVVQEDFTHTDWRVRFTAVERVTVVARFMDQTPLFNEPILQAALANVFCYLISSMDDENVQVAQRATLYLGTIHDSALRSLVMCLETQFDTVMVDRPVVLQALYQLHNCLSDRKILTWDFFLSRFDALFLEAQINLEKSGDISFVRDLRNSNLSCESFTRKYHRAQEALSRSESSNDGSVKTLSASFGPKWPYKRTMSAPASMVPQQDNKPDKEKVYSRQYSAPILKRKSSRFGLGQFLGSVPPNTSLPDGHIHQLVAGDDSGLAGLSRVLNLEGNDHETIHLLIFLLMQFLSRPDQAFRSDEKSTAKTQAIVLRHLFLLLGYSQQENTFYFPPHKLRSSPVFNAFLSNLPQVLDQNHLMGWIVAGPGMAILQHCPAGRSTSPNSLPSYTLWLLESHSRRCWLMAVLVILYKYNYNQQPQCTQVTSLVRIVLNTLCAQHHVCKRVPASIIIGAAPSRSREVSQPSLGGDREDSSGPGEKLDTPPLSPMCSIEGKSKPYIQKSPAGPMETHWEEPDGKHLQSSVEGEEGETEALPDWKSESTLKGSPQDVEEPGERKLSLHEKMKWFKGGDDDVKENDARKCGVKQGVMMMVASSFFASTQPVAAKETNLYNGAANQNRSILPSGCGERRPSLACAVASAMQPVVATATVVSGTVPAKTTASSGGRNAVITTTTSASVISITPSVTTTSPTLTEKSDKPKQAEIVEIKSEHTSPQKSTEPTSPTTPAPLHNSDSLTSISTRPVTAPWRIESALSCSTEGKESPRGGEFDFNYGSPDSPLSKMDVITLGSPIDIDNICSRESCNGNVTHLEMPPQERLLPVGPCQDVVTITDRLHRALTNDCCSNTQNQKDDHSTCDGHKKSESTPTTNRTSKADSLDHPDVRDSHHVRSSSPRRLIKQVALAESPPEEEPHSFYRGVHSDKKHHASMRDRSDRVEETCRKKNEKLSGKRRKKVGLFSIGSQPRTHLPKRPGSWCGSQQPLLDPATQQACHAAFDLRQSSFRIGDECVLQRCAECGAAREEYSDEELGLCIVILGTFIHREPGLAAPLLPEILSTVAK